MESKDWAILGGLTLLAMIPIWRSGLKENMTFPQFVGAHTVGGEYPEYIPEDMLNSPLSPYEMEMINNLAIAERYGDFGLAST